LLIIDLIYITLEMFEIGYNKNRCKIVLPIRDVKGKLVGFTERMDYDGEGPKYWHDHFSKSDHLYGLHLLAGKPVKRLFLTEGQLDSVRLWQLGLRACAIMGSSISQEQVRLLVDNVHCEKLVLAFDNDEAGEKATLHAARLLAKTRFSSTLYCAKYPGKDPGELTSLKGIKLEPWFMALPLLKGG
jgi:DNA primase